MGSCCRAGMIPSLYLLVAAAIVACTGCGVHGAAGDVKFVALVHRHGDRSPVRFLPTDAANNAHWVDGPGQLTPIGIHQLHTLGASLRQRYLIDRGVVPETYSRRFVHVRSTDVDRTLMSAESLLEGIFPPGTGPDIHDGSPALTTADLQPVPIHTVPNDNDPLLRGYSDASCPKFRELYTAQKESPAWQAMEAHHADFIQQARVLSGLPDLNIATMFGFHDPLVCDRSHNLTWPAGVTDDVYDEAALLANFSLSHMFYTKEQRKLGGGVLVGQINSHLSAAAKGTPQPGWTPIDEPATPQYPGDKLGPRMALFSAHDTTLAALLSALYLFNGHNPPYASSVVFELLEVSGTGGDDEFGVRIFYNQGVGSLWDSTNILELPGCTDPCPLAQFQSLTADIVPADFEEECQLPEVDAELFARGEEFVVAFVAIFFLVLVVIIVLAVRNSHKKGRLASAAAHHRLHDEEEGAPNSQSGGSAGPAGALSGLVTAGPLPTHVAAADTDDESFAIAMDDESDDDHHADADAAGSDKKALAAASS